ncbi:MAG: transglycosylase domain-containing protein [Bacteroidales bacterium]
MLHISENKAASKWIISGALDKHDHIAKFSLYSTDIHKVTIPFIKYKWNAQVAFDTLNFSVEEKKAGSSMVSIAGSSAIKGLEIDHPRIAAEKITFGNGGVDYTINIGNDYYELDSVTHVLFNSLSFNPYLKYRLTKGKQVTLKIDKKDFPADDLFTSLPPGLFQNLDGLKTKGELSFHLLFDVDLRNPDSLKFECELDRRNFHIVSYGKTNFTYINEPFDYTAYEKGEAVRTFSVGPSNPNFRNLEQISPLLRNSVLNSEDGAFFGHRGFLPEAFRESIVTNIKERRFARGGSTITMQLVKNVFLNRNKTIARKLEEALIVWMIENLQLSSKERMFEIYLNVIEWGPLVYGAQEASKFYFNKDVSKLSYAEAIYLASIIPRPKYFRYTFDKETGGLRDYILNYYQRMADKMLKKEMISQEEYDRLKPEIELKGPARQLLLKPDSLDQADSLMLIREEFLK